MKGIPVSVVGLWVVVAGLACGEGSGPRGPVSIDQFPGQFAHAVCTKNFQCASASDIGMNTMDGCVEETQGWAGAAAEIFREGELNGRISYHPVKMEVCIRTIKSMSCDEWGTNPTPPVCFTTFTPKVAAGSVCENDFECVTGECQTPESGASPPLPSTCVSKLAEGAPCTDVFACASGLFCGSRSGTAVCLPTRSAGQPCLSDLECKNSCNPGTGTCSAYVGCAIGPATPRPGVLAILILGTAALLYQRSRRSRAKQ